MGATRTAILAVLLAASFSPSIQAQSLRKVLFTAQTPQAACAEPAASTQFALTANRIYLWFFVDGAFTGDTFRAEWTAGDGALYTTHNFTPLASGGSWCFNSSITPATSNIPLSKAGAWNVAILRNGTRMSTATFQLLDPAQVRPSFERSGMVDPWNYKSLLSPGSWVSIYGDGFAVAPTHWSPSPNELLQTRLGDVRVTVAGIPAALSYVSSDLVNVLIPGNTPEGNVDVVVERSGMASSPVRTYVQRASPALYSVPGTVSPLKFYVTAVLAGTSDFVGTAQVDPRVSRGIWSGDLIDIYAIGLGRTRGQFPTDRYFTDAYTPIESIGVLIDPYFIRPEYAALVAPGLYVVRVRVPNLVISQDVEVRIWSGDIPSPENVFLTFENRFAPMLTTFGLSSNTVRGGQTLTGNLTISRPAPPDGTRITLRSNNSRVRMPAALYVEPGSRTASFSITTDPLNALQNVTITATQDAIERQVALTIEP